MDARRTTPISLKELAQAIGGELIGDERCRIAAMRPFDEAEESDITFVDPKNARMVAALPSSRAGCVIVGRSQTVPPGRNAIRIDPPHLGLARALAALYPRRRSTIGVSPAAHVAKDARIAKGANIFPGAFIGEGVEIAEGVDVYSGVSIGAGSRVGRDTILYPNVTLYEDTVVGERVVIHAGAVIGADGFGFTPEPVAGNTAEPLRHAKIPQIGHVVIEDDVEIGANTTIDRATMSATVIGRGTKIDNLVMIGHNTTVGRHSIVVAQVGVSGSTQIGNYVTIAGQAGVVGHITIGDRAVVTAQAGVTKDVNPGQVVIGSPAVDLREGRLAYGLIGRLPELKKQLADALKRIEKLEKVEKASSS